MAANSWFFYALLSAVFYGISYSTSGKIVSDILSPSFLLLLQGLIAIPLYLFISHSNGSFKLGFEELLANKTALLLVLVSALAILAGNFFIYHSMALKNATLANLVEISYPVFTLLFAWVLFKDIQLNWASAFGGLLIFAGITVIYLKS